MDFRVFSRNISENMHARCVREDTKQALKGNLQADGVQSRQTLFVRYCQRFFRRAFTRCCTISYAIFTVSYTENTETLSAGTVRTPSVISAASPLV